MRITKKAATIIGATVAVAALSSTGTAVAGGLITTKQIKDSAVTADKVKNGSLTLKDFKASERSKLVGPANSVVVQSPVAVVAANDIGTVVAFCPAGKKVTGGGYFSSIAIAASSSPSPAGNSWGAVINNSDNIIPVEVWAYAVCA